jgi:hypothetical protein
VAADAIERIQERFIPKVAEIRTLAAELASAGIDEETVQAAVHAAYEENFRKEDKL